MINAASVKADIDKTIESLMQFFAIVFWCTCIALGFVLFLFSMVLSLIFSFLASCFLALKNWRK